MIHVKLSHDMISVSIQDEPEKSEDEIIDDLVRDLSYIISVFKMRIEKRKGRLLEPIEEAWINIRIKESMEIYPLEKVRDIVSFEESTDEI